MSGKATEQFRPIFIIHMKKLSFLLVAMMIATVSFAQSWLVATLSHSGDVSVFYGADAISKAMDVADHGDVITLSPGQFNGATITKAITLRGAGMYIRNDSLVTHESTIITDIIFIDIQGDTDKRLFMEDFYCKKDVYYKGTLHNPYFSKIRFEKFSFRDSAVIENATFTHCRFASSFWLSNNSSASFISSIIKCPVNYGTENSGLLFSNCYVIMDETVTVSNGLSPSGCSCVINSYFENCIIQSIFTNDPLPVSNTCYNCLGTHFGQSSSTNHFINLETRNNTNTMFDFGFTYVFTDTDYRYDDKLTYKLKDEYKTYLGTDGKEVGIYGGNIPYSEEPSAAQIVKFNVSDKADNDGTLKIDVEVKESNY